MTFVFFHVGEDLTLPTSLVLSLLAHNPGAEIIQVTDRHTPTVSGVSRTYTTEVDRRYLMLSRTAAWAHLGLDKPALYLDTDMIANRQIDFSHSLDNADIAMCRRSYNRDYIFNTRQRGLDFPEYEGRALDDLYPYVGCCTISPDANAWAEMAEMYYALPEKFWRWYGDQEVLREYSKRVRVAELAENVWAGLPEFGGHPLITHYKGQRKRLLAH